MFSNTLGFRLRPAALTVIAVLLVAAGCSSDTQPAAGPAQTVSPIPGPSTAAPGPKGGSSSPAPPSASGKAPGRPSSAPPPASTPVPPSTPGDVNQTVPARPERVQKPVRLDQPSQTGTGLTAQLASVKSIKAKAQLPGEIAGPALAVTVQLKNNGSKPADLNTVVVTLLDSKKAPGGEMTASPAKPLTGTLAPGKSAQGVYVFSVPENLRKPITVNVTVSDAPVLVFVGNAN